MNRFFAFVLLAFGFGSAAHAVPTSWTDQINFGSNGYVGSYHSLSYNHYLTDDGFRPLVDQIDSFTLAIDLADDETNDRYEAARIWLPLSSQEVTDFSSTIDFLGYSILGRVQLNVLGFLTVTIQSLGGDFNVISSTLTANGDGRPTSVPEPGALGLLGIGLIGVALSKRRRKAA